jgi:peptidyl-tRNA hydrolase, PTH1 family
MLLLVGLGNPGSGYAQNRHNIGFMAVDVIAGHHDFSPWRAKFGSEVAEGRFARDKVLALKPTTYMNRSGQAVSEAMHYYKLEPTDVIVIHDDIALEAGKIRTKTGGGHAGNNGVRNIIKHLGAGFHRLRIGVGHPGNAEQVQSHVLSDFSKADQVWRDELLGAIADNAALLAKSEFSNFTTAIAAQLKPNPKKPMPDHLKKPSNGDGKNEE